MTRPIANRVNVALEMGKLLAIRGYLVGRVKAFPTPNRCCERGMTSLNVFWLRGAHR